MRRAVARKVMRVPQFLTLWACGWLCVVSQPGHAQTPPSLPDTVDRVMTVTTTAATDTIIPYSADRVEYSPEKNIVILYGKAGAPAKVEYRDMVLEAGMIRVDLDSSVLYAQGMIDSQIVRDYPDSNAVIGEPVFTQVGSDPMYGEQMTLNLETRKGLVLRGRTTFDEFHIILYR